MDTFSSKVRNAGYVFRDLLHYDPQVTEKAYRRHSGIPRRALFDAIAADAGAPPLSDLLYSQLSDAFTALNQRSIGVEHVFPGVPRALTQLRHLGFTLVISSSAPPEEVVSTATITGLAPYFDKVLGSQGECVKGRGHVDHVCQWRNLRARDICMVGDEPSDIRLARDAGARVVVRQGTYREEDLRAMQPDSVIREMAELPQALVLVEAE